MCRYAVASLSSTGSMRPGFLGLCSFMLVALMFLVNFDIDKAYEDRRRFEKNEELVSSEFQELRTGSTLKVDEMDKSSSEKE